MSNIRRRIITGISATPKTLKGTGRVGWNSTTFGKLPRVVIKGVGEQKQLTGKNLFDLEELKKQPDGWNFGAGTVQGAKKLTLHLKPNTDYLCSSNVPQSSPTTLYFNGASTGTHNVWLGTNRTFNSGQSGELFIVICWERPYGKDLMDGIYWVQIEEGTTSTEYEPYCGGVRAPNPQYAIQPEFLDNVSIMSRGRNLLDESKLKLHCNLDTNTGGELNTNNNSACSDYIEIPEDRNIVGSFSGNDNMYMLIYDKDKKYIGYRNAGTQRPHNVKLSSIPNNETAKYIRVMLSLYATDSSKDIWLGIDNVPYEPYFDGNAVQLTPILRAFPDGNIKDEIDINTGILIRRIKEYIVTGNPNEAKAFNVNGSIPATTYNLILDDKAVPSNPNRVSAISNYFIGARYNDRNTIDNIIYTINGRIDLCTSVFYKDTGTESLPLWQKYLSDLYKSNTPVKIWYELETPIIEHYDPAILRQHPGYTQLIQQGGPKDAEIEVDAYPVEEVTL